MLIENEILDKLCPSYQEAIRELEEAWNDYPEDVFEEVKTELLVEFCQKYLMLKELWDKYFE